jgi:hypothetical protein
MKNRSISVLLMSSIISLSCSTCDKSPQVFSVNNFKTGFEENGKNGSVLPMPVKGITGL